MRVQAASQLRGSPLLDAGGSGAGTVVDAYCRDGDPYDAAWALVRLHGLPRPGRLRVVPLRQASFGPAGQVQVPYERELVTASPAAGRDNLADAAFLRAAADAYPHPT